MAQADRREREPPDDPEVDRIVLAFIGQVDDGSAPSVDDFCAQQPEPLRERIRARCLSFLEIQRVLRQVRSAPRPVTTGTGELTPDPMLGRQLGSYVLERRLGEGGMGVVYLARQAKLDRPVAVKVLPAAYAAKRGRRERFDREARLPAKLDHPGIVKVFDAHEEGELRWYVMEYVAGRSLHDILQELRRLPTPEGDAPSAGGKGWITRAAQIAAEVADALDHAHQRGVVHRDLKPQNILIDASGATRVVDFGLALDLEVDEGLTVSGEALGTPHYMSPEQVSGDRRRIGAASDLYTLGVVLYEMLTLRRPFEGATREKVLASIASAPPRPVRRLNSRVPRDLETICLKALEKNPQHRYASAADFARDLRHFLHHEAIEAQPPPIWRRIAFGLRQRRGVVGGFVAGALLLLALALAWRRIDERARAPKLTVRGRDADRGARIWLRQVDPASGAVAEKVEIGTLPLERRPLEPGCWRIVVEKPGVGFCEMTRYVAAGEVVVEPVLHPTAEVERGMRTIPAGPFRFGDEQAPEWFLHARDVVLPEFLIDERAVSNADYQRFLTSCEAAKRPHAQPWFWRYGYDTKWNDLPVVGVSWQDALDYAEWAGKRLPTLHEWEKAARGTAGALFPWGNDVGPLEELVPDAPDEVVGPGENAAAALWRLAVARLHPVDVCDERAIGPFKLLHTLGNVREWTETERVDLVDGRLTRSAEERYVKGGGWRALRGWKKVHGLALIECMNVVNRQVDVGFRCARSKEP